MYRHTIEVSYDHPDDDPLDEDDFAQASAIGMVVGGKKADNVSVRRVSVVKGRGRG